MEDDLRQAIAQVQQGQEEVREKLLKKYLPYILKITARSCKRFVKLGEDDEVSIALMAFSEALDKYDLHANTSFFAFAESVLKRRLIDYFRKMGQAVNEVPWSALGGDHYDGDDISHQLDILTWEQSKNLFFEEEIQKLRREEIISYQKKLREYGITLQDLIKVSPKHQDARAGAFQVAQILCAKEEYFQYLEKTGSLPLKKLAIEVTVSRKTLERQRKYIIALTIIIRGNYSFLQEYLEGLKG